MIMWGSVAFGGARVGGVQADNNAYGRRFTRAVRSDEAGHLTGADRERHPVQRLGRAEPFAQSVNLDTRVHGDKMSQSGGAPRLPAGPSARCRSLAAGIHPQADDPAPHGGYDRREHDPAGWRRP